MAHGVRPPQMTAVGDELDMGCGGCHVRFVASQTGPRAMLCFLIPFRPPLSCSSLLRQRPCSIAILPVRDSCFVLLRKKEASILFLFLAISFIRAGSVVGAVFARLPTGYCSVL